MNIKFHDVISDLTGVSGMKVKAILAGERQPERLLELCDKQIQKKKSERVLESLHGVWAPEHLFALGQVRCRFGSFIRNSWPSARRQIEAVLKDLAGLPPASLPSSSEEGEAKGKAPAYLVRMRRKSKICTRCCSHLRRSGCHRLAGGGGLSLAPTDGRD